MKRSLTVLTCLVPLVSQLAGACPFPSKAKPLSAKEIAALKKKASPARKPTQSLSELPFGGADDKRRQPEAGLANLFKKEIAASLAKGDVKNVIFSVPARLRDSGFAPFGDRQTNARADYGNQWKESAPPVFAKREILKDGSYRDSITLHSVFAGKTIEKSEQGRFLFVRLKDEGQWWPLSFDHQVHSVPEFMKGVPEWMKGAGGKPLPDPERIGLERKPSGSAYQALLAHKFTDGYNTSPYPADSVHGRFPTGNGESATTAVGGVLTWLVDKGPHSSFKQLYTCFDGRNPQAEADAGVPSGAGWHRVGDPAETILNTIEDAPVLVAIGNEASGALKPGQSIADGFNSALTALYVNPNEAFVTTSGQYHWYAISEPAPVCTEIWVHNCEPNLSNHWGFACN